jgi:Tol biopolymer transport system component
LDWRPVPFTSKVGRETSPAISPDGTQIVYSYWIRTPDGQVDLDQAGLRLQAVGAAEAVRLTTHPDANPAWSPNGREIAFIRFSDTIAEVELVLRPAFGGAERVLRKLDYAGPLPGPYVSFSPDGKWILTSAGSGSYSGTPLRRLVAVNRDTGETQDLLPPVPGTSGDLNPVLSPSGKRLAFCRCSSTSSCDLYEVAMDQLRPLGEPRRLTRSVSWEFRSAFLPDESLVYSLGPPHARALWRVSFDWRNQPRHEMLSPASEDAVEPSIAWGGDGTIRVIYTQNRLDSNIWRLDLHRPDGPPLSAAPVIASTAADDFPAYSFDSSKIAFTSTRSGSWELWTCAANGTDCHQRSDLGSGYRRNPAWAVDGKSIVFDSTVDGATQLYQADLAAGAVRQLTRGDFWNVEPAFSPDGKWLYYASNRSGRFEIYRTAVGPTLDPQDRAIPVTREGGASPRITPDGADLVYRGLDRSYLRLNLATGRATNLLELSCVSPTPAPNGFVYGFLNEGLKGYLVRIQGAKYERLHQALLGRLNSLARSPDGASLAYVQTDRAEADLMMVRIPRM